MTTHEACVAQLQVDNLFQMSLTSVLLVNAWQVGQILRTLGHMSSARTDTAPKETRARDSTLHINWYISRSGWLATSTSMDMATSSQSKCVRMIL
jgi:hypothetical protein